MYHALNVVELRTEKNETAALLAEELGLAVQAERYRKGSIESAMNALPDEEVIIWQHYCPTRYSSVSLGDARKLEDYAFDNVPIEVLKHWQQIKTHYAFDRYEIWTTEKTPANKDPLLVGILGERVYLLARWGLEAPGSLSVATVAKKLHDGILAREMEDFSKRRHKGWFQSRDEFLEEISQRALDWCLHHAHHNTTRLFAACRKVLKQPVDPIRFHYSYIFD